MLRYGVLVGRRRWPTAIIDAVADLSGPDDVLIAGRDMFSEAPPG